MKAEKKQAVPRITVQLDLEDIGKLEELAKTQAHGKRSPPSRNQVAASVLHLALRNLEALNAADTKKVWGA